jgi:hypothetical protein
MPTVSFHECMFFSYRKTLELGFNWIFWDVSFLGDTFGYIVIRMDVRIPQISRIGTDF